ncbi:MAG TPA: hypothetical protein ENJ72_00185 [Thermodesulfatator sp.]|nr:hypothetical protein [Thermodesulfatator sp.]
MSYLRDLNQKQCQRLLNHWLRRYGLSPLASQTFDCLWNWLTAFEEAAPRLNLTAAKSRSQRVSQILEAIILSEMIDRGPVLDLGSGAGIPGLIGAIHRRELSFTLAEALTERVVFMNKICLQLGLRNCQAVVCHFGKKCPLEEGRFGSLVSRGFGSYRRFLKLGAPYAKQGARFFYLLRPEVEEEQGLSRSSEVVSFRLPDGQLRYLLIYER